MRTGNFRLRSILAQQLLIPSTPPPHKLHYAVEFPLDHEVGLRTLLPGSIITLWTESPSSPAFVVVGPRSGECGSGFLTFSRCWPKACLRPTSLVTFPTSKLSTSGPAFTSPPLGSTRPSSSHDALAGRVLHSKAVRKVNVRRTLSLRVLRSIVNRGGYS
jgi:hypothetical protein